MRKVVIAITIVIVFLILFGLGSVLSENCVSIGNCKGCWTTHPTVVTSDLCSNKTCVAQPTDQQNNAIVDVVMCACDNAKASGYSDSNLNSNIQSMFAGFSGYNVTADNLCNQPGMYMAKRSYG